MGSVLTGTIPWGWAASSGRVTELDAPARRWALPATCERDRHGDQAGQDDQDGKEHLRNRGDQRDAAGSFLRTGGHGALDDQEVGAPVSEAEDESQAHGEADPLDAQRDWCWRAPCRARNGSCWRAASA